MKLIICYSVPAEPVQNGDKPVKLLAKYNYRANPDRPGGFDELTITQGENLEFCRAHPTNPHWWEARNGSGNVGFVPATYMMVGVGGEGDGEKGNRPWRSRATGQEGVIVDVWGGSREGWEGGHETLGGGGLW